MKKVLFLSLAVLFVAAGCSQTPTEQVSSNILNQEFGGYTTENEAPAFGDAALLADAAGDVIVDDDVAAAITAADSMDDRAVAVFALRIVWGQLELDTTSTTPTVWDGSLAIDSGRIGVLRTLLFEEGQDYVERLRCDSTRCAPNVIGWVSTTTVHHDGLLLLIGMPASLLSDSTDNMLTFATGPLTYTFSAKQLYALDTVISVDDAGNAVMFNGFEVRRDLCPKGFLAGRWMVSDTTDGGTFRGRWMSRDGRLTGYVDGRWGHRDDGKPVFFGKYIDENGNFEGRMRGVWGPNTGHNRGGFFRGVFYDPTDKPAGRLHGRWKAEAPGEGLFQGVWKMHCPKWDDDAPRWRNWEDEGWDPGWIDHPMDPGMDGRP